MISKVYNNALTEVYEILNYLDEKDYNKIPRYIIEAIEENRNKQYVYYLDESISFIEQKMLLETQAILFYLYRNYLATAKRKEDILKLQNQEYIINEKIKKEKYQNNLIRRHF